ncbi:MAG: hypothetical protein J0L86_14005 [Flavobacteriales bacterium]|nr:hypothetical protein [Flavobacteriales bacterium]
MKTEKLISTIITIIVIAIITSCSNNDDDNTIPSPAPIKSAKFEITGNYTGQFTVVYNDNVSGNTTVTVTTLPWSKTVEYPNNVIGIGIGGNTILGNPGIAGQTATLRIYNGNSVVASSTKTADANGIISFQTLAYVFP